MKLPSKAGVRQSGLVNVYNRPLIVYTTFLRCRYFFDLIREVSAQDRNVFFVCLFAFLKKGQEFFERITNPQHLGSQVNPTLITNYSVYSTPESGNPVWGTRLGHKELEAKAITSSQTEKEFENVFFTQRRWEKSSYSYTIDLSVIFQDNLVLRWSGGKSV